MFCKDPKQELHACSHPTPQSPHGPHPNPLTLTHPLPCHTFTRCCCCFSTPCITPSFFSFFFFLKPLEALKYQNQFFLPFPLSTGDGSEWQPLAILVCHLIISVVQSRCQPACGSVQVLQGMVLRSLRSLKLCSPLVLGPTTQLDEHPLLAFVFLVVGYQVGA